MSQELHRQAHEGGAAGRPNVVIVLLDDVGFADLGCFGGEIETPNIDRLAACGLRYNGFRTTAICSPTRAALLTGLNHHSAGMGFLADFDGGTPGYRGDLTKDAATIAEILRDVGFGTFMVGKWHVNTGSSLSQAGPMDNWPPQRGFDRCYWFNQHSNDFFRPYDMYEGNSMIQVGGAGYYITDDLTRQAIRYVRDFRAADRTRPFLLYVAYNAAHSPLQALPEDRDKYLGRYDCGWDEIRRRRLERQKALGIVPPQTELPPRNPGVRPWDELSVDEKRLYARYMEVYAGMIDRVDANIGTLIGELEALGELDDTIFMFLSDNGASAEGTPEGTANLMLTAYAQPLSLEECLKLYPVMGETETFPHYPRGWAMASNTPFKLYKQFTTLGGIRDPLIVHWPAGTSDVGSIRTQYVHVNDILPTVLDAVGIAPPSVYRGREMKPIEGVSFAHTFDEGGAPTRHLEQYYEIGGQRAMDVGDWRIVTQHKRGVPYEQDRWQLYDLRADFNEMHDLSGKFADRVVELERRWHAAAARFQVLPLDDRNFWKKIIESRRGEHPPSYYRYLPPVQPICAHASPRTGGRSHRIVIDLSRDSEASDGVLVAYGSRYYGYALYVQDGRLCYEVALAPRTHLLMAEERLGIGRMRIEFRMEMIERPLRGRGALYQGGRQIAERLFEEVIVGVPYDGLDLGADCNVPVSTRYVAPFPFAGVLHEVEFFVDPSPPTPEEFERDATMIEMMS